MTAGEPAPGSPAAARGERGAAGPTPATGPRPDLPATGPRPDFTTADAAAVRRAMALRRDMRHFRPDPVPHEVLDRLLQAAHMAPSVGYMQPWRFVRVTDPGLRCRVRAVVEAERHRTATALGEREAEFLRLKVEGIGECGEVLVVALADGRERFVFGRRTLPEMDVASAACAIQNMWLTARVEGLGMGWVSIFDPAELAAVLRMPEGAKPLAILCLGYVDRFYDRPLLEEEGWDHRRDLRDLVGENAWPGESAWPGAPSPAPAGDGPGRPPADPGGGPGRRRTPSTRGSAGRLP